MTAYPEFWEHEYSKHLICAIGQVPQMHSVQTAFQSVVQLHSNITIHSALLAAGIKPSMRPISLQLIISALQNEFGVLPQARCNGPSMSWLSTVLFCFNTELQLIDCPTVGLQVSSETPAVSKADALCSADRLIVYPTATIRLREVNAALHKL